MFVAVGHTHAQSLGAKLRVLGSFSSLLPKHFDLSLQFALLPYFLLADNLYFQIIPNPLGLHIDLGMARACCSGCRHYHGVLTSGSVRAAALEPQLTEGCCPSVSKLSGVRQLRLT